jgi:hypothetical protein
LIFFPVKEKEVEKWFEFLISILIHPSFAARGDFVEKNAVCQRFGKLITFIAVGVAAI